MAFHVEDVEASSFLSRKKASQKSYNEFQFLFVALHHTLKEVE